MPDTNVQTLDSLFEKKTRKTNGERTHAYIGAKLPLNVVQEIIQLFDMQGVNSDTDVFTNILRYAVSKRKEELAQ